MADRNAAPRRSVDVVDALRAAITLAGIGMVGYGAWSWWQPAGFMLGGGLLVAIGVLSTLRAR